MSKNNILAWVLCSILGLTSCTKDEGAFEASSSQPIVFSMPLIHKPQSRAVGEIATYPMSERFVVNAVLTQGDFVEWDDPSSKPFMNNVEVQYIPSANGWSSTSPYYWPKSGKLTFVAHSPAALKDLLQSPATDRPSYGATGLTIPNFMVPPRGFHRSTDPMDATLPPYDATQGVQCDVMYTDRAINKQATNQQAGQVAPNYNGIDMKFRHALASIHFKICVKPTVQATFKLQQIRLTGIAHIGSFAENLTATTPYTASPRWTVKPATTSYTVFDTPTGVELPKNDLPQPITTIDPNDGYDLILLPQDFTDKDAQVEVVLTMSSPAGGEILQRLTFRLEEKTPSKRWNVAHRYTYNIIINPQQIYFNPEVEPWETESGGNITIE